MKESHHNLIDALIAQGFNVRPTAVDERGLVSEFKATHKGYTLHGQWGAKESRYVIHAKTPHLPK